MRVQIVVSEEISQIDIDTCDNNNTKILLPNHLVDVTDVIIFHCRTDPLGKIIHQWQTLLTSPSSQIKYDRSRLIQFLLSHESLQLLNTFSFLWNTVEFDSLSLQKWMESLDDCKDQTWIDRCSTLIIKCASPDIGVQFIIDSYLSSVHKQQMLLIRWFQQHHHYSHIIQNISWNQVKKAFKVSLLKGKEVIIFELFEWHHPYKQYPSLFTKDSTPDHYSYSMKKCRAYDLLTLAFVQLKDTHKICYDINFWDLFEGITLRITEIHKLIPFFIPFWHQQYSSPYFTHEHAVQCAHHMLHSWLDTSNSYPYILEMIQLPMIAQEWQRQSWKCSVWHLNELKHLIWLSWHHPIFKTSLRHLKIFAYDCRHELFELGFEHSESHDNTVLWQKHLHIIQKKFICALKVCMSPGLAQEICKCARFFGE